MSTERPPFQMTLDLNVLEHLGINLYSNVPAVLSEVVANAWDADASSVAIDLAPESIVIQDNGVGMTVADVNARFLTVGYRRRQDQPGTTAGGRLPMGRKGIGKLSLFSIADTVEVQTRKDGQSSAFRMSLPEIRQRIRERGGVYEPVPIDPGCVDFEHGTRIVLTDLKRRKTIRTAPALRKRIARRFSIIGPRDGFEVIVNGEPITPADRDYYSRLQYLWTYGDQTEVVDLCDNLGRSPEARPTTSLPDGITISGWLATVKESKDLKDEDGENLNRIAINVRGKMAEENVLGAFSERGIFVSYLVGELRVDALDLDEKEDAATSSRQSIVEDDPRYVVVKDFIRAELRYIEGRWASWRIDDGATEAMTIPAVSDWMEHLPREFRKQGRAWIGKINKLSADKPEDRKNLIKHAIIAFEFYRANTNLEHLDALDDSEMSGLISLFKDLNDLEANLYGQIVRQRLGIIGKLKEYVDKNELEKVIQKFIFDHLWLIDTAWERADASEMMERRVDELFRKIDAGLTPEEKAARIDIKYRRSAGTHIIIELKRPDRSTSVYELAEQIGKYRNGMLKLLSTMERSGEEVRFVCLVGKYPRQWEEPGGQKLVVDTLGTLNAKILHYNAMLDDAYESYNDYLKRGREVTRLQELIQQIEDYAPEAAEPEVIALAPPERLSLPAPAMLAEPVEPRPPVVARQRVRTSVPKAPSSE